MSRREKRLDEFIHENARFFQQPVIQTFMAIDDHWDLLKIAIEQNDLWASEVLDRKFEVYYLKIRMMRYINTVSRFYVNTYDQTNRKHQWMLTLDQSINAKDDESSTRGDLIPSAEPSLDDAIVQEVQDLLPTKSMNQTYQSFSETRKSVMYFYTFNHLNDQEISEKLNCTPQNVSKTKRKAFYQLRGG